MRLENTQKTLKELGIEYHYWEEDNCGSIDFLHRGLSYHIWEFSDGDTPCGVETNLLHTGKSQDIEGDYEDILVKELKKNFR